jgi:hypothetical protein
MRTRVIPRSLPRRPCWLRIVRPETRSRSHRPTGATRSRFPGRRRAAGVDRHPQQGRPRRLAMGLRRHVDFVRAKLGGRATAIDERYHAHGRRHAFVVAARARLTFVNAQKARLQVAARARRWPPQPGSRDGLDPAGFESTGFHGGAPPAGCSRIRRTNAAPRRGLFRVAGEGNPASGGNGRFRPVQDAARLLLSGGADDGYVVASRPRYPAACIDQVPVRRGLGVGGASASTLP